jgi:hypothetical protein
MTTFKIQKIFAESVEFQHQNRLFTFVMWVTIGVIWTALAWVGVTGYSFIGGVIAAMLTGYVALAFYARHFHKLTARISATGGQSLWTVSVNGVVAGQISDADYANILRNVSFDLRVYIAQSLSIVRATYRFINRFVLMGPIVLFWGAFSFWFSYPDEFASTLDALQGVTPHDLAGSMPNIIFALSMFALMYWVIVLVWRADFKFDCFEDAIARDVLQHISCPANGRVTLSR